MIEQLIAWFKKDQAATKGKTPEGICPNCWGYHEYDNQIREAIKDNQIDINNHRAAQDFLQKFKTEHLEGIQLVAKKEEHYCPTCKTSY